MRVINSHLPNRNSRTALTLTKVVVPLPVDLCSGMHSSAMALADKTLAHSHVLVSFVAAFGEANPSELVHLF